MALLAVGASLVWLEVLDAEFEEREAVTRVLDIGQVSMGQALATRNFAALHHLNTIILNHSWAVETVVSDNNGDVVQTYRREGRRKTALGRTLGEWFGGRTSYARDLSGEADPKPEGRLRLIVDHWDFLSGCLGRSPGFHFGMGMVSASLAILLLATARRLLDLRHRKLLQRLQAIEPVRAAEGPGVRERPVDHIEAIARTFDRVVDRLAAASRAQAQTEEQARVAELSYRILVETSPDIIIRFDRNRCILFASPAVAQLIRPGLASVVGAGPGDLRLGEAGVLFLEKHLDWVWATNCNLSFELTAEEDGVQRVFDCRLAPEPHPLGRSETILCYLREVTEFRDAKARLRETEHQYKVLYDFSGDAIFVHDFAGKILDANQGACERLGLSREELLGASIADTVPEAQREDLTQRLQLARQEGLLTFETAQTGRNGQSVPTEISARVIPFQGQLAILCAARDISIRKRALSALENYRHKLEDLVEARTGDLVRVNHELEEEMEKSRSLSGRLLNSRQMMRTLMDSISDLAMLVDGDGSILAINKVGAGWFSAQPADLVGRNLSRFLPWSRFEASMARLQRSLCENRMLQFRTRMEQDVLLDVTLAPVSDGQGQTGLAAVFARDVTAIAQHQAALRQAKEEADRANRARGEFLANMSHEIRTPLTGIIGLATLLADTDLSAAQQAQLAKIESLSDHLLQIISDILDYSKVDSGMLTLESRPFHPASVVESVSVMLAGQAALKGISLSCRCEEGVPAALVGDSHRLRQVLLNLAANAIKFTGSGGVWLTVRPGGLPRDGLQGLDFEVRDSGIGIPAEKQGIIFESFTQADGAHSRKYGGTGLGLSICRSLVELMGGRIEVESTPGQGSAFRFTAWFALAEEPRRGPEPLPMPETGAGLSLLLAEDFPVNQEIFVATLTKAGFRVRLAEDGAQVLAALDEERFDLVLMDLQMPTMDGFEATRRIREHPDPAVAGIAVVALTAGATDREQEACRELGMAGLLSKPLQLGQLYAVLGRIGLAGRG